MIGSVSLGQLFSLRTVSHDSELMRKGPRALSWSVVFLTLYFPLLEVSSASASSSEEDKEKALT